MIRRSRGMAGMALIECMMALLIFSVGLLGLLGLEARVMNTSVESDDRNRAAMFANEVSSHMWLNGSATLPAADYTALQGSVADQTQGGVPSGTLLVTPDAPPANAANITITWQEPSDAGNLSSLTTRVVLP